MRVVQDEDTPEGTLKTVLEDAENLEGVIVIALKRDGTQALHASHMNMYKKTFLMAFAQAYYTRWFKLEDA